MSDEFDHDAELARLRQIRDARKGKAGYKANVAYIEQLIKMYEAYLAPEPA